MRLPQVAFLCKSCLARLDWEREGEGELEPNRFGSSRSTFCYASAANKAGSKWLVAIVSIVLFGPMLYGQGQQRSLEKVPSTSIKVAKSNIIYDTNVNLTCCLSMGQQQQQQQQINK